METLMDDQGEEFAVTEEVLDISQLCRVCANPNEYLIPIFHGEGLEHDLKSKASRHLPIPIKETDTLPIQLCYQCASTLIAWSDLVEGCAEAEEKLKSLLPEDSPELTLDDQTGLQKNKKPISLQNSAALSKERSEAAQNATDMEEQQDTFMDQDSIAIESSQQRSLTFRSFQLVIQAHRNKLLDLSFSRDVNKCIKPKPKAICKMTDSEAGSENINEILFVNINTCSLTSDNNSQLKSKTKPTCDVCGRDFTRMHDLKRHMLIHFNLETLDGEETEQRKPFVEFGTPDIPLFTCEICCRIFKKRDNFERHKRIHSGELPFECGECKKRFRDTSARGRHQKQVHKGERTHKCVVCARCFANRSALTDHMQSHEEERKEQCHQCGLMFKTKACLYQHSRIHTQVLGHVCGYCGRAFRRRQELNAHISTHTNQKSHICDKCGKGFNVRRDLQRHLVVHSEERPHACGECKARFGHKRYLKNHMKMHHGRTQDLEPPVTLGFAHSID